MGYKELPRTVLCIGWVYKGRSLVKQIYLKDVKISDMNSQQSKSFSSFLFGFIAIIAVAFSVLIWSGLQKDTVPPVDNVAQPN